MDAANYSLGGADPSQAFTQGLQGAIGLQGLMQQQQAQQQAFQAKQQQILRAQQMQADMGALGSSPSPAAIAALSVKYPELSEQLKRSHDMMSTEQKANDLSHMTQVYAAVTSGRNDIASKLLRDRATALENSGAAPEKIQGAKTAADWIEAHPDSFQKSAGILLAGVMGPDKFAETFGKLGEDARANAMAPLDREGKALANATEAAKLPFAGATAEAGARKATADATTAEANAAVAPQAAQEAVRTAIWGNANTRSQIQERAARLGLDRDKLTSETQIKLTELNQKFGQLPDDARKLANESAVQATASEQGAGQMLDLASRLERESGEGMGAFTSASEWLKKATGNQNALTGMRQEYTRLMSQGVIKMLPPGPASDKDVALAREGFPPANADAAYLASFLRGMGKMQAYDAALQNAKSEWAGAVQHLGKTKTDIEVDGIKVPAGTTFADFSRQYLARKANEITKASELKSRGYMKYATPQGGATGSY